jgi:protocatechuate 3,4-dioxygenase beta subunit
MDDTRGKQLSRRTAFRVWLAGASSLTLLAAAGGISAERLLAAPADQTGGPGAAPAQVPAATPAAAPARPAAAPVTSAPSAAPAVVPAAAAPAMCVMTPEQTEGPYYIDLDILRQDITEGKPGIPLRLDLTVLNAASCQPLSQATVEVWHCDAAGDYSGFSAQLPDMQGEPPGSSSGGPRGPGGPGGPPPGGGPGGPGGPPPAGAGPQVRNTPTNDMIFLRGGQISDARGKVTFDTIYPGWYRGRTVHIHIKVHVAGDEVHTSQSYFDDGLSDTVFGLAPYDSHQGRDTRNATDNIFANGGQQGMLTMTPSSDGYVGTLTLGVQV